MQAQDIRFHIRRGLRALADGSALAVFGLAPVWLKWEAAPEPFTPTYVLGFVVVAPLLLTVGAWLLAGLPGIGALWRDKGRLLFVASLVALVIWAALAQGWAFVADRQPGVAQNAALQIGLVTSFALAVACDGPPLRRVLIVLAASAVLHAGIGFVQVALQTDMGLGALGEFTLDPARSGISVIQAGDLRWLRPHGLLPHPNPYAGFVLAGALAGAAGVFTLRGQGRWLALIVFAVALWALLLSFSRGAWLGFGAAVLLILPHLLRQKGAMRRLLPLIAATLALGAVFFALYQPLIFARAGVGAENTELRSVADRAVFSQIAVTAIAQQPLTGLGGGNFPWYASYFLHNFTDFDLRGDNVHHVFFTVWAEYGLIGFGLLALTLAFGMDAALRQLRRDPDPAYRLALLALCAAYILIGLFDHYPWTLIGFQALWFGALATAGRPAAVPGQNPPPAR